MQFMGAADTHLKRLDSIHEKAQRIRNFTIGPLKLRREASRVCRVDKPGMKVTFFHF